MRSRRVVLGAFVLLAVLAIGSSASAQVVLQRVVAVVDDEAIFLDDLERAAAPFLERVRPGPGEDRSATEHLVYERVLEDLVDRTLIRRCAARDDVVVSDADVEAAIDAMRAAAGLSNRAFASAVRAQGFASLDALRRDIRDQLLHYRVLNLHVRSRVNVTETEVRDVYDAMVARGDAPPPSFEDAHDDLYRELLSDRMEAAQVQFIAELRRRATIEIRL